MPWKSIRGHDRAVDMLRHALSQGRLPHAFLFVGPEGIGKRSFAETFAQALLCERAPEADLNPCGACPGCLQVAGGAHPDVYRVARAEDKQDLAIKQIRELCLDLGLKPAAGRRKIAIIDDADDMNEEAANAFLKTLEEPPPGSVLILIATSAETQLDTVVSRCRVLRFDPLPEADLAQVLLDQSVTDDPAEAKRLAHLADGSIARARGLADATLDSFRRSLIADLADPHGFDAPGLSHQIDAFVKEAGKESAPKRERARLLIGELARFFRGILWQTAGIEPPAPDPEDRRAIATLAARIEPEDVYLLADRCLEADYHVRRNVYLPLIFDALMHDLGKVINPRGRG
jgi:DNA polymerase III subunit delta'